MAIFVRERTPEKFVSEALLCPLRGDRFFSLPRKKIRLFGNIEKKKMRRNMLLEPTAFRYIFLAYLLENSPGKWDEVRE